MNATLEQLILDRESLARNMPDDGYPGSKAWKAARAHEKLIAAFDAEHPEVIAHIRAEHAAEMAKRYHD